MLQHVQNAWIASFGWQDVVVAAHQQARAPPLGSRGDVFEQIAEMALCFKQPTISGTSMSIESRLKELGLVLPEASNPQGSYTNCVRTGNLLYVSGKGPVAGLTETPKGKLGREYTVEQGYEFARLTGLDILAAVQLELGTLEDVSRVVKIQGFVNATEEFEQHPKVLDGCSDLMAQVFGEKGVHARSVFGAVSVRGGLPIIIDSIFELNA